MSLSSTLPRAVPVQLISKYTVPGNPCTLHDLTPVVAQLIPVELIASVLPVPVQLI